MVKPLHWLAGIPSWVRRVTPAQIIAPPRGGLIGLIELPAHDGLLTTEDVQWWYWTGHLEGRPQRGGGSARAFGFEMVFFVFDTFEVIRATLGQAALTDRTAQRFHYGESLDLGLPEKLAGRFTFDGDGGRFRASGADGLDHLSATLPTGEAFDLVLRSHGPAALHYGGFPHPLRCGGFTYYYSRPRMTATGTVTVDGTVYDVSGDAWFDRQYGQLFQLIERGWQWFALSLEDGTRIMLFDFPAGKEQVENFGAVISPDGAYRLVPPERFEVKVLGTWKSPKTNTEYPARWSVKVEDYAFELVPWVADQELSPSRSVRLWIGPEYWEGACDVLAPGTSRVVGKAYVELNGYADSGAIARSLAFLSELFD